LVSVGDENQMMWCTRIVAAVVNVGLVVVGSTVTATAATHVPSSQQAALAAAATGAYSSSYGTLTFAADGTADFEIKNCGFEQTEPGVATVRDDCAPTTYTGRLRVGDHSYEITQADHTTVGLEAYVDDTGALHVGSGTLGSLGKNRAGTITTFTGDRLRVGHGTCTYTPAVKGSPVTAPCTFTDASNETVLVFRVPDEFKPTKTVKRGFVYLAGSGLLVDPVLVPLTYTRP
jgi:hypothetical protein